MEEYKIGAIILAQVVLADAYKKERRPKYNFSLKAIRNDNYILTTKDRNLIKRLAKEQ